MKRSIIAACLCAVSVGGFARARDDAEPKKPGQAPAAVSGDVDAYIEGKMRKRHVPGVSVAVVKDGKVALLKGYGVADVEHNVPATADTVYQLASVTKTFTAAAVMMLVKDGKLSLDDKITDLLPDLPKAWEAVTVRHLITHTSGIKSYTAVESFSKTMRKDYAPREIIDLVVKEPLLFPPGERWDYSNTGYFLLGLIIEKAAGKPYADVMAERIFKPLGMDRTRINDLRDIIKDRARGYEFDGKALRNGEYVSPTQPFSAGALVSSVSDLVKWDAALAEGKLLDASTLEAMWKPTPVKQGQAEYGFGWQVGKRNGHGFVAHGGGIPGFSTQITRYLDDKLTVIVLTNTDGGQADGLARGIAARFLPALAEKAVEPITDPDPPTSDRLRALITGAQKGEVDPELFTPEARKQLVPHIRSDKDTLAGFGELRSFDLLERKDRDGAVVLTYRAAFANEGLKFTFALDKEGKIAGINIRPED